MLVRDHILHQVPFHCTGMLNVDLATSMQAQYAAWGSQQQVPRGHVDPGSTLTCIAVLRVILVVAVLALVALVAASRLVRHCKRAGTNTPVYDPWVSRNRSSSEHVRRQHDRFRSQYGVTNCHMGRIQALYPGYAGLRVQCILALTFPPARSPRSLL